MAVKVGYLGPDPVTFGFMAAEKYFAQEKDAGEVEFIAFPTHTKVIEAVGPERIDFGVVAIENVIDGAIPETIRAIEDEFGPYGIRVVGEVVVPIKLFYLRKTPANGSDTLPPKKVLSHDSPIRQCRTLITNLQEQGVVIEVRNSTGEAAREASENSDLAVIASANAEKLFRLQRVSGYPDSVADHKNNMTRFWIVGRQNAKPTGHDKTAFLLNLRQEDAGVLYRALGCFCSRDNPLSLLFMYLNPIPGRIWEYTFLVEFRGHIEDERMKAAFRELRQSGLSMNTPLCLGSYHDATTPDPKSGIGQYGHLDLDASAKRG